MKKIVSVLLAIMCVGSMVTSAFAASATDTVAGYEHSTSTITIPHYDQNVYAENGTQIYQVVSVDTSMGQYIRVWFKSSTPAPVDVSVFVNGVMYESFPIRWPANADHWEVFWIPANVTNFTVVVQRTNSALLSGEFAIAQYFTDPT